MSWSSGVTLAFPVPVTQRSRTRARTNSLLAAHHSNYGTIKAWWHLIFCHFLRLNSTNASITFPLTPGGFRCVSGPSPALDLSASHLPIAPLLRQGQGFLRNHFVWHSAFHFPLTSSYRPPFVSLLTYIRVLPRLVGSSLSRPPWSLSTPRLPHTSHSVPLLNNQANFFPPVSSGQHSPKTLSAHQEPTKPAAGEQTRRQ